MRRASRFAGAAAALLAIAGCATAPRFDAAVLEPTELADVPFFPQTQYQCGPAALATILAYEGVPVDAGDLAPAVYVEGLRGSLQAELLGATRRHGFVPYPIEATPEALFDEVAEGKPVLVLQNLGLKRLPVWHYAVVIGFDDDSGRVLLRSGTERRRAERLDGFLRSWRLGGNWGFVAAAPGELPATATPERYVRAVAGAESLLSPAAADAAYAAAADRWPEEPLALFALAGRHAGAERWDAAATAYRTLLRVDPDHAAARNNLANVLAERGCRDEALRQARAALDLVGDDSPLRPAIEDTVESLSGTGSGPEPGHCRA
ncbi:MAG: PA2778 family cysteine peptidase [Gammaproteobacteria bacterium]|nr:PA2778 family cysteine peptidase [Gammaproteobacteria bacterium]